MDKHVLYVIRTKHPEVHNPLYQILDAYSVRPYEMVPMKPTEDMVVNTERRISWVAGLGGMALVSLQHWII